MVTPPTASRTAGTAAHYGAVHLAVLVSIALLSLLPENLATDFTLGLRPLVLSFLLTLISAMTFLHVRGTRGVRFRFAAADIAFAATLVVSLVSFVRAAHVREDFHCIYLASAGFIVYFALRVTAVRDTPICVPFSIAALGALHAIVACVQFAAGHLPSSTFGNRNLLALFLALAMPITLSLWLHMRSTYRFNRSSGTSALPSRFILCCLLLQTTTLLMTGCRTTFVALGLVVPVVLAVPARSAWSRLGRTLWPSSPAYRILVVLLAAILFACLTSCGAYGLYRLKPLSAAGRVLTWRVTAAIVAENPMCGIGFGNFGNVYHAYQGRFFAAGNGSSMQIMAADRLRHAFNWYLETAAELGLAGMAVFALFWICIIREAGTLLMRQFQARTLGCPAAPLAESATLCAGELPRSRAHPATGMAGAVICFMLMCLFHFPHKIIPTYLLFTAALAWVVTHNQRRSASADDPARHAPSSSTLELPRQRMWLSAFWAAVCLAAALFVASHLSRHSAGRQWHQAETMARGGNLAGAIAAYSTAFSRLSWNPRFLSSYADALLQPSLSTTVPTDTSACQASLVKAIQLYERATAVYTDPYVLENMGKAYACLAARRSPATFAPGNDTTSNSVCIAKALRCWQLAAVILPWKLAPKYCLALLYYDVGDTEKAHKWARQVLDTPLKRETAEGARIKAEARALIISLDSSVPGTSNDGRAGTAPAPPP